MKKSLLMAFCLVAYGENLDEVKIETPEYRTQAESTQSSSTLKEEQISKSLISSTSSLSSFFHNLKIYAQGSDTFPMITLRGVSGADYYSYVLGLYVDGVPQSPNFMIQTLGDVESVRLVNGAEGLFYGENASLGLLEITTKNPLKGNYANLSLLASFLQEDIQANIGWNLLPSKLWFKVNARYIRDNGFIKDPQSGKMLNSGQSALAGVGLYYMPTEQFLLSLHYNYHYVNTHKDFFLSKLQFDSLSLESSEQISRYEEYQQGVQNKIFNKSPFNTLQAHNASVKMEYFFADSTLSSISAFQKTNTLGNSYPGIFVQDESKDGNYYDTTEFVQELRLHTNYSQGLESLFGVYYKYFLLDNGMDNVPTGSASPALPPLYYNGTWRAIETTHTIAFFSDVHIPYKQWAFNLGLRYQFYNTGIDVPLPPMAPLMPHYQNSISFHSINPRASVIYSLNDDHQLFFTFANSTKPAGFSKFPFADIDTLPYKQEQVYTLELGNHSKFLSQSLKLNSSLYTLIRDNTQAYVGEGYNKSIANIGKAYAFGVDIELSYENSFLSTFLNTNVGYSYFGDDEKNKGELIIGGNPSVYDVRGLRTRFSPIVSFNAGVDFLLFSNPNHRLTLSNLLSFSSAYYLDDFNRESDLVQKPFVLWDMSLIYELFKHYEITLFAQNLTNSRYATSVLWDMDGKAYTAGNPFNFGAKVSYKY